MLGDTLDYWLLKTLAHRRNIATEAELDARAAATSPQAFDAQMPKLEKLLRRFGEHLPIDAGKSYLDMGCGTGELTLALAGMGAGRITGVDFLPRSIDTARAHAARIGVKNVSFACADLHEWQPPEKYDVLLSFDAFEHIDDPRAFLLRMKALLAPGGVAVVCFGPLFHSPFGDHMWGFFRVQLPWRGVLFSEEAMLRVRRECFRPTDPARRLSEIAGGLNRMRYSEFIGHVHATGWEFDFLAVNTFLRQGSLARKVSDGLARLPGIRDYVPHNVYAVLKPA
jgi:SAM-dependent methyltransferase